MSGDAVASGRTLTDAGSSPPEGRAGTDSVTTSPTDRKSNRKSSRRERAGAFLQRTRPDWLPPLIAMLGSFVFLVWRARYGISQMFKPQSWGRWDTGQYLKIARHGYIAAWHCGGHALPPHLPPGNYLCGTIGWFPGYPMAVRLVAWLPLVTVNAAALAVAWTFWYLLLFTMWRLLADSASPATRWACLIAAAFVPGEVYFSALFPLSLCITGILGCLYFSLRSDSRRAPLYAFGLGALASYSYLTAIVLAPALLITAVTVLVGRRRWSALSGAVGAAAGLGAVLLHMQLAVGIWDAYFISVRKYGLGTHNPLQTLGDRLSPAFKPMPSGSYFLHTEGTQTLLTLVIVGAVTVLTLLRFAITRRRVAAGETDATRGHDGYWLGPFSRFVASRISGLDLCVLLLAIGTWMIPYIAGGSASTYRSEAFIVLAIPLLRRLPAPVLIPLIAVELWVAAHMIPLFVNGKLI